MQLNNQSLDHVLSADFPIECKVKLLLTFLCLRDFKALSYPDNTFEKIYLKVLRSRSSKLKSNFFFFRHCEISHEVINVEEMLFRSELNLFAANSS